MNINICFSSDNNYAQHMGIAIASILNSSNKNDQFNFYILDGGISKENKQKISSLKKISSFNIQYIKINANDFKDCPMTNYVSYITQSTYYRFGIPRLLKDIEKVLYLDCDIIVNSDIRELYDTDIKNYYLAAIPEVFNNSHQNRLDYKKEHYYCNAGVLLINNKKWIEDKIEDKLFEYIKNPSHPIIYQDQDILNEVLKYKIKYLPLEWNLQHDAINCPDSYPYHNEERDIAINNPKLVHFTNPKKPWKKDCNNIYQYLYYQNAKNTPWKHLYYTYYAKQTYKKIIQSIYTKSNIEYQGEGLGKYKKTKYTILGIKLTVKRKKTIEELLRCLNNHEHSRCEYLSYKLENIMEIQAKQKQEIETRLGNIQAYIQEKSDIINYQMRWITSEQISKNLSVYNLHQKVFPKYKNINEGKDVVLIATGPTFNDYKSIENAVHIGVNSACCQDKVLLDYWFGIDYPNIKKYIDKTINYRKDECKKFFGLYINQFDPLHIPDNIVNIAKGERYYINYNDMIMEENFYPDLTTSPLPSFWSVSFQAAAFALWTKPKKLYLVGCDESSLGHFDGSQCINHTDIDSIQKHKIKHMQGWEKLKQFASIYYPDTEIISINPVGLKGLFKDVYTESYLAEHPEIRDDLGGRIEIYTTTTKI